MKKSKYQRHVLIIGLKLDFFFNDCIGKIFLLFKGSFYDGEQKKSTMAPIAAYATLRLPNKKFISIKILP